MTFLTPEELQAISLNAFGRDLTDEADERAVELAIEDAEARVQNWIHRHLFVSQYTIFPGHSHAPFWAWSYQRSAYGVWAPEWPVVQVSGDVTFTETRIYSPTELDELTFYAGYRRADQGLSDLQAIDGLDGLTALPPALPGDVRRVMAEVALIYLRSAVEGTMGSGRKTQSVGQSTVTVETVDTGAEVRALRRLRTYQRVA